MRRVLSSKDIADSATVIPSMTRPVRTATATTSPEMTALAARHISTSPAFFSLSLKMGMNAAVRAPSPSRRRNKLGIMNAKLKALATAPSPMKLAKTISRTMPRTRLKSVATPMAPDDFNICDIEGRKVRLAGLSSKFQVPGWEGAGVVTRCSQAFDHDRAASKSGGERAALQTLREVRGRPAVATAFGMRWL